MSGVLIDSDLLIEVLRARDEGIVARWRGLLDGSEPCFCTPINVAEVWRGARDREHEALRALFAGLDCLHIDNRDGELAGAFLRRCGKSHGVELGDALVAGAAVEHGLLLWTRHRKHFPMPEVEFFWPRGRERQRTS